MNKKHVCKWVLLSRTAESSFLMDAFGFKRYTYEWYCKECRRIYFEKVTA